MSFGLIKITPADKMFSLYIRYKAGWKCERCFAQYPEKAPGLHNSHYWGRGNLSVRHDEENCAALCAGCHQHFTANPGDHRDFFLKRLGNERYDLLEMRARKPSSAMMRPDDKMVALAYKEALKRMGIYLGRGPALL